MNIFKSIWTYVIIIVIVIAGIYAYQYFTKDSINPGQQDEFAAYLTEQGAIMYGTDWCSYCKKQKELFGDSFRYINYVNCDQERQVCVDADVKGYPTWEIDGETYSGLQSLERLAQLTRYEGEI